MADFDVSGMSELIDGFLKTDLFDEEVQSKLLLSGSEKIKELITEEGHKSGQQVSDLLKKLSQTKKIKKDKDGNSFVTVTVTGKNKRGERNATIVFVLNYGRSEKYGKIQGSYFWTKAVQKAASAVVPIYEKIISDTLKDKELI